MSLTGKGIDQAVSSSLLTAIAEFLDMRQEDQKKEEDPVVEKKYKQLLNSLEGELRQEYLDYCNAVDHRESINCSASYKSGFCDGVKTLLQILLI